MHDKQDRQVQDDRPVQHLERQLCKQQSPHEHISRLCFLFSDDPCQSITSLKDFYFRCWRKKQKIPESEKLFSINRIGRHEFRWKSRNSIIENFFSVTTFALFIGALSLCSIKLWMFLAFYSFATKNRIFDLSFRVDTKAFQSRH